MYLENCFAQTALDKRSALTKTRPGFAEMWSTLHVYVSASDEWTRGTLAAPVNGGCFKFRLPSELLLKSPDYEGSFDLFGAQKTDNYGWPRNKLIIFQSQFVSWFIDYFIPSFSSTEKLSFSLLFNSLYSWSIAFVHNYCVCYRSFLHLSMCICSVEYR